MQCASTYTIYIKNIQYEARASSWHLHLIETVPSLECCQATKLDLLHSSHIGQILHQMFSTFLYTQSSTDHWANRRCPRH